MVPMAADASQRTLATIIFTDGVGFSRLAGLNEAHALSLLSRDLDAMKVACAAHGGKVLNQTGDGLLMMFTSAAGAMRCALDIQGQIATRIRTLPADEVLHHRIGIHVGDVVFEGDQILGDGVNVAARLQSEAKTDSIAISRTVHDLIKNKVAVNATYMGPRILKNIPERVPVWMIPLAGDGAQPTADQFDLAQEDTGASGAKGMIMIAGSAGLVLVMVFLLVRFWPSNKESAPPPPPTPPVTNEIAPGKTTSPKTEPNRKPSVLGEDAIQAQIADLTRQYQFDKIVNLLQTNNYAEKPNGPDTIQRYQSLSDMWTWIQTSVSQVTQDHPLEVTIDMDGNLVPCKVYGAQGGVAVDSGSGASLAQLQDLRPTSIYNIGSALSQMPDANPSSQNWLAIFREVYSGNQQKS